MVRRCWKLILVCWVPFLEVGKRYPLLLQDQEECEESPERWKPVGLKCCAGVCESIGLADHNRQLERTRASLVAAPDAEAAVRVRTEAMKTELYTRDPPCVQMFKTAR